MLILIDVFRVDEGRDVDRVQLFDLQADPQELRNLAGDPAYAPKIAALTKSLEKELQDSGDTAPLKVANPKPADWSPPAGGAKPGGKGKAVPE